MLHRLNRKSLMLGEARFLASACQGIRKKLTVRTRVGTALMVAKLVGPTKDTFDGQRPHMIQLLIECIDN